MLLWVKGVLAPWAEWYIHGGKACTQEPTWNAVTEEQDMEEGNRSIRE